MPQQGVDARQARLRAVREGAGLLATCLFVGVAYLWPLGVVLVRSVPQVALLLPDEAREITVYLDGLPEEDAPHLAGGDGGDGDDLAPDAPEEAAEPMPLEHPEPGDDAPGGVEEAAPPPAPPPDPTPAEPEEEAHPVDDAPSDEQVAEDGGPDEDAVAAIEAPREAARKGRRGRCGGPHPDIQKVGATRWRVQRHLVDHYTSSMERFNSLGYSRKYHQDGVKGWLVGGFGCKSPLWKAGLRSRDVIRTVNGKKTNNVVQLLGIWMSQRRKTTFTVELLRNGEPLTLHYTIVEDPR